MECKFVDTIMSPSNRLLLTEPPSVNTADPPPPYPTQRERRRARTSRRTGHPPPTGSTSSQEHSDAQHLLFPSSAEHDEHTPLIPRSSPPIQRQRTLSSTTNTSAAPSLAHTVFSLFHDSDLDISSQAEHSPLI